jgi:hypothetical protein
LGIGPRLESLLSRATDAQASDLISGCERLLLGDERGEGGLGRAYKACAIVSRGVAEAAAGAGGVPGFMHVEEEGEEEGGQQ